VILNWNGQPFLEKFLSYLIQNIPLEYEIWVESASIVYHVGGGTLSKSNLFKTYLNFRNNWFFLIKNLPINKLRNTLWIRFFSSTFFFDDR